MPDNLERFVRERQVDLLFRNVRLGQAVAVINAGLLAWVASGSIAPALLIGWVIAVACMAALRLTQARAYHAQSESTRRLQAGAWLERGRLGVFGSSLVWSGGSLLLMQADSTGLQLFTAFVAAGMTAGAVPVLAADPRSFRIYAWPIILSATVGSLGSDALHLAFTAMSILFFLAVTRSADYFHDALLDALRLEHEKDDLLTELRSAKQRAELSDRAKTEFLANISHELRTPMNGIIGMTELLSLEPLTEEQQDMLRPVRTSADQLLQLISNMLELSALEAGHFNRSPTPFSPDDLAESLREEYAQAVARKGLELMVITSGQLPPLIVADLVKIKRVLAQLLDNAIKFTEHGRIEVRIGLSPDAATLNLAVADSGPGIPASKLAELAGGLFVQGDGSVIRRHGGTGIGIPIARKLVELLGGRLEINSTPGKGSRFSFSIPVAQPDPETTRALSPDSSDPAGPAPA